MLPSFILPQWNKEASYIGLCFLIDILLWHLKFPSAFEIIEKEDVFKTVPCPAFLLFDNAAYLADMSFELPCNCKPEEVTAVVWYFQKNMGSKKAKILTDFNGTVLVDATHIRSSSDMLLRFSIRMFNLIVFRAQVEDTGHYMCGTRQGDYFYGYDVDVQSSQKITVTFEDQEQHPQKDQIEQYFSVFTTFWEWTKCDRCGVRGEQRRIGLCYLKSNYLFTRYYKTIPDVTSCGSAAVPKLFKKAIMMRNSEVVIRSCMVKCPKCPTKNPKFSLSNIISKLGRKRWSPEVPIQLYTHPIGYGLIISCPGARPEQAVAWDKEKIRYYRTQYLIGVNRTMRIYIDHGNHLNIRFVQLEDRGIYYCWLDGQLIAGFRLAVTFKTSRSRSLSDPETIYALNIIFTSYVFITILFVAIHCCRFSYFLFRCC
ncbi:Ig-like V-type domain-containing protein FAM187A [Rhinatrema bivittatum]|uniref:Ig-like V-type domain-containing protein FAM187A n=1 Tax=Rhinatrema bivittatum TaxID=194408 RepID=UPI001127D731|nr:Ig-like V-type domain-containing protein FAM187A [Rhinatrema bivittatum]